jgi:hypothetical protein
MKNGQQVIFETGQELLVGTYVKALSGNWTGRVEVTGPKGDIFICDPERVYPVPISNLRVMKISAGRHGVYGDLAGETEKEWLLKEFGTKKAAEAAMEDARRGEGGVLKLMRSLLACKKDRYGIGRAFRTSLGLPELPEAAWDAWCAYLKATVEPLPVPLRRPRKLQRYRVAVVPHTKTAKFKGVINPNTGTGRQPPTLGNRTGNIAIKTELDYNGY